MSTLKWAKREGRATNNMAEAIEILYERNPYHHVILYASTDKKLSELIRGVNAEIKKRNTEIEDINKQMLPTYPYHWDDIDGCLHVKCAEISMDEFEHNAGCIALFTGYNYSVLTNPDERRAPSQKAMTSLAMLGYLATHNN